MRRSCCCRRRLPPPRRRPTWATATTRPEYRARGRGLQRRPRRRQGALHAAGRAASTPVRRPSTGRCATTTAAWSQEPRWSGGARPHPATGTRATAQTDGAGNYSMTAMPTTNGEVYAGYDDGARPSPIRRRPGPTEAPRPSHFYPGRVYAEASLGGPWAEGFEYLGVRVWGTDRYSYGRVPANGTSTPTWPLRRPARRRTTGAAPSSSTTRASSSRGPSTSPADSQAGAGISVGEANAQRAGFHLSLLGIGQAGLDLQDQARQLPGGLGQQRDRVHRRPRRDGVQELRRQDLVGRRAAVAERQDPGRRQARVLATGSGSSTSTTPPRCIWRRRSRSPP